MTILYRRRTVNLTVPLTPIGAVNFTTQSTDIDLGDCILHKWIVRIPNGHAGQTGVALTVNGVVVVPFDNPTTPWVMGNDDVFDFVIETEIDQQLAVAQLNEDYINHTHYLQFEYTPIAASAQTIGAVSIPQVPVS